jgi:protein-S-isoprenylcysteine O-methyltransferase Ste14
VLLQTALMGLIMAAIALGPHWPSSVHGPLRAVGTVLAVVGGAFAVSASRALGPSFTPYPRPASRGHLVETGPYRVVRHPVYAGLVVLFIGFALAFSPLALVPTALIAVAWGLKVRLEERFLRVAYPDYERYAARTRYRIVPLVY